MWEFKLPPCAADTIRVVGVSSSGQEAASSNSLAVRTGRLGAPTLVAASPTANTTALVRLSPPTSGSAVTRYLVSVCLKSAPTKCVAANGTSTQVSVAGLAAGASYTVTATAVVGGSQVPASNSLPLTMPPAGAPILLTAAATSAVTGAATAAAPGSITFKQVRPAWLWAAACKGLQVEKEEDVEHGSCPGAASLAPCQLSFVVPPLPGLACFCSTHSLPSPLVAVLAQPQRCPTRCLAASPA